jgi:hypothetical protein
MALLSTIDDERSTMSKPLVLHTLTIKEASLLTKEQILAIEIDDLSGFKTEADLDLLNAIKRKALSFLSSTHATYKMIQNKYYRLENKDAVNAHKRTAHAGRKDVFSGEYSETKYEAHETQVIKWNATILQVSSGQVIQQISPRVALPDNFNGTTRVKESGLFVSVYLHVKDMTNRQKNDTVTIMGRGFGRGEFCHDTASTTHRILQEIPDCSVMLIDYVPAVDEGEVQKVHTIGAALFAPVNTKRHGKTIRKVQGKIIKTVNLVQIATLPSWSGRNLGAIALEHSIKDQLKAAGFDLMIICGCHEHFYRKLEFESNPDWLYESPFNLDVPEGDSRSQQTYNRDLFFFFPLTVKYENNIEGSDKDKFAFEFAAEVLQQYYGVYEEASPTELMDRLEITDENVAPNSDT